MFILGFLLPILLLVMTRTSVRSWRLLRLFSSYLIVFTTLHLAADFFGLGAASRYIFLVLLGVLEAGNLEHVINNNSNQNFLFVKFLFDPVFLKGSGISKRFFIRMAVVQLVIAAVIFISFEIPQDVLLGFLGGALLMTPFIPVSSILPDWMQENWILFNVKNLLLLKKIKKKIHLRKDVALFQEKLKVADKAYAQLRPKEEGRGKWIKQDQKPNILLIVVEGLGEVHLKKGWLPHLSRRKSENLAVKTFLTHQRNTNRGLYSLYSGKHPNLVSQSVKPDLVAQYGKMDTGLAEVLVKNDYRAVYLQGAPSVFMCKDRFLPQLGFEEVIGEEKFPKEVPRIKWGVDDQQLYKLSVSKIDELVAQKNPWFLSLLTVTTHHPIEASNKVLKNLEDGFRYADEELEIFLNELEAKGLFESTLICITSDEVAGDGEHVLSENLGTMIMLTPDKLKNEITHPFTQSDVAFSLCDYLNIDDHPFLGRSFFRTYDTERPLYFASIFQQKSFLYQKQQLFIQYYSGKQEMLNLERLDLLTPPTIVKEMIPQGFQQLDEFVSASDRGLDFLTTPIIMDLKEISPDGELVVKSPGFIKVGLKKGEKVILKFEGENRHADAPLVVNWLIQDMKHKRSFKPNVILLPGSSEGFDKVFVSPGDSWYDLSIRVMANNNNEWVLRNLQISMVED